MNTKRVRDYLDNVDYVNGAKNHKGELVIRSLNEDEKAWLDKFNSEYYNANFEKDDSKNLHKVKATEEEIKQQRQVIRELKKELSYIKDSEKYRVLKEIVDEQVDILVEMYPRKTCTDARNSRNRDLLNFGKATNKVKFLPWDTSNQNSIGFYDFDPTRFDDEDDD